MDPNQALSDAREAIADFNDATNDGASLGAAERLVAATSALDGWLTGAGFPPAEWAHSIPGEAVYMITVADVEGVLRRPLLPGEKSSITKTLEHGIGDLEDFLDGHEHDSNYADFGASGLIEGHWFREYGMDDWLRVTKVGNHGDRVLLWAEDVDGTAHETSLDADTVVALLTTEP
jgi:hypothetical protein